VELQNFQQRKRLLEYDDVMNQQREVVYSLRSFALEGGEELKGEALKMLEKAVGRRVETTLEEFETAEEWDRDLLKQELLMHYLLRVPELEEPDRGPTTVPDMQNVAVEAARAAFWAKLASLDEIRDHEGGYGDRLLALVMLNVLDEKWKDHLYDLDQLRNAIHYRSWGQKDPLIEYKQEAYTMFVDLMNDIYDTFSDRFLKAQLMVDQEPLRPPEPLLWTPRPSAPDGDGGRRAPTMRYNALGILEPVPAEEDVAASAGGGTDVALDVAPAEPPKRAAATKRDPVVVGAGKPRSLKQPAAMPANWSDVGRNDPCPCGSGKKFKKCHGAAL
jgi:preprotein translocase subunit SecA